MVIGFSLNLSLGCLCVCFLAMCFFCFYSWWGNTLRQEQYIRRSSNKKSPAVDGGKTSFAFCQLWELSIKNHTIKEGKTKLNLHPQKLTAGYPKWWFRKGNSLKKWQFLVSMLDLWGVTTIIISLEGLNFGQVRFWSWLPSLETIRARSWKMDDWKIDGFVLRVA